MATLPTVDEDRPCENEVLPSPEIVVVTPPSGRHSTQNPDGQRQDGDAIEQGDAPPSHSRRPSFNGPSFLSKLAALTASPKRPLAWTGSSSNPAGEGSADNHHDSGSDADAEAEESAPETTSRRFRPVFKNGSRTAPTSPGAPPFRSQRSRSFGYFNRGGGGAESDDEGRRPSGEPSRLPSNPDNGPNVPTDSEATGAGPSGRGHFRGFTGKRSESFVQPLHIFPWSNTPSGKKSSSGDPWKILASLRRFGLKKSKHDEKVDNTKSSELIDELMAGSPAALMLASMFQRDEKGHRRIPVLLEQLRLKVIDSQNDDSKTPDRHVVFKIDLEYGNGSTLMRWSIHRTLGDFVNLHLKYKFQSSTAKYIRLGSDESARKLPRFPKSAFPYLRGVRGLVDDDEEEEDDEYGAMGDATDAETTGVDRPSRPRGRRTYSAVSPRSQAPSQAPRSSFGIMPDPSTPVPGTPTAPSPLGPSHTIADFPSSARRETYIARQKRRLEQYLQRLLGHFMFSPESNRLCKFLELSALGVRLAAEGGYHGKEGYMMIRSYKGRDFRKVWSPSGFADRHSPKWFLVRHSYIVCVDSPEDMNVYDVFLVDSAFEVVRQGRKDVQPADAEPKELKALAKKAKESAYASHHQLKIYNSENKVKLLARNDRQLHQFEDSIRFMKDNTIWSQRHRFDSFAPVRNNVYAQWLVDGRDYMWNISRAVRMAKDVIYIHDWWLSPELYLRRPAAVSQKWRLDRLLQKKAQEGVKIFVIMYRNINNAIPIDSGYSKFSLLDLHPNVFVQRSPNPIRQNTLFWAHHEKLLIVDHLVAFCGGIDLCFGRWDSPDHVLVDDKPTGFEADDMPKDADHCQVWPGKDYSNPRVLDFHTLNEPYEELYDRTQVPRMPWHDVGMQIVGQPARDMTRHFVQRWNYLLRQRKHTRPTPFLLPPPDFNPAELEQLNLSGTCEIQLLRSACDWSLGLQKVENSIEEAYVRMIELSDHFIYIENQFFVTSTTVDGTLIENRIGIALVDRIKRAHANQTPWRATIIIPLMPGFEKEVDDNDASSLRRIMHCQYQSISRGEESIFGRLDAVGIDPEDYINFYGLRNWAKIGPRKALVTEQVYIHAKIMIVDDRMAIIGSANINERSMRGNRDSELAALVRDRDLIESKMYGQPYKVSRFAHTLRMRLMREHLGLDVDAIMAREMAKDPDSEPLSPKSMSAQDPPLSSEGPLAPGSRVDEPRANPNITNGIPESSDGPHSFHDTCRSTTQPSPQIGTAPASLPQLQIPEVTEDCMVDPLDEHFYQNVWDTVASNNTEIYRKVFRCMPDNEVRSWKEYRQYTLFQDRLAHEQGLSKSKTGSRQPDSTRPDTNNSRPRSDTDERGRGGLYPNVDQSQPQHGSRVSQTQGSNGHFESADGHLAPGIVSDDRPCSGPISSSLSVGPAGAAGPSEKAEDGGPLASTVSFQTPDGPLHERSHNRQGHHQAHPSTAQSNPVASRGGTVRVGRRSRLAFRRFRADKEIIDLAASEDMLQCVQGNLVEWPYDWLVTEDRSGGWLFDQIAPLDLFS